MWTRIFVRFDDNRVRAGRNVDEGLLKIRPSERSLRRQSFELFLLSGCSCGYLNNDVDAVAACGCPAEGHIIV